MEFTYRPDVWYGENSPVEKAESGDEKFSAAAADLRNIFPESLYDKVRIGELLETLQVVAI